jgi:hypothetical protein
MEIIQTNAQGYCQSWEQKALNKASNNIDESLKICYTTFVVCFSNLKGKMPSKMRR